MIRKVIVPFLCLFCERGRKLLKLQQHVTLCLLLRSLVSVQHLVEVLAVYLDFHIMLDVLNKFGLLEVHGGENDYVVLLLLDAETNHRICFLNVSPDEVIRSLFYNKNNDSLITVSVYASDNFSSLKCRSTRIEYVTSSTLLPPTTNTVTHIKKLCNHPIYISVYDCLLKILSNCMFQIHTEGQTRCWLCSF